MRPPSLPFPAPVVSVTELNRRVRALLENQFEVLWVAGELSNVKLAGSGHWYFCLKDPGAQIERAYRLALGRAPTPRERTIAAEFVARQSLAAFCTLMVNLNEFVYVD